jgi:hypothetical protein
MMKIKWPSREQYWHNKEQKAIAQVESFSDWRPIFIFLPVRINPHELVWLETLLVKTQDIYSQSHLRWAYLGGLSCFLDHCHIRRLRDVVQDT